MSDAPDVVYARNDNGDPICGAKLYRKGAICNRKGRALGKNGRCFQHSEDRRYNDGGAPTGNQNALKHGIYSRYYTEEEYLAASNVDMTSVDAEIKICSVRLLRLLNAEKTAVDESDSSGSDYLHHQVEEEVSESGENTLGSFSKEKTVKRRINWDDKFERLIKRLESLKRTRAMLLGDEKDADFDRELDNILNDQ